MEFLIIGLIISALSTGYSAYSGSQAAKAQAKQLELNAEAEADAAEKAAEQERLNRDAARKKESKQLKRRRASIEAAYAKSGVGIEGTPEAVLAEQIISDEIYIQNQDRISIARERGLEVSGLRAIQEASASASALRSRAQSSLIAGTASAVGGALTAAGQYDLLSSKPKPQNQSESWMFKGEN